MSKDRLELLRNEGLSVPEVIGLSKKEEYKSYERLVIFIYDKKFYRSSDVIEINPLLMIRNILLMLDLKI